MVGAYVYSSIHVTHTHPGDSTGGEDNVPVDGISVVRTPVEVYIFFVFRRGKRDSVPERTHRWKSAS